MRTKKFILPIYHSRVVLIESSDFDEVLKYFKKIDYDFYCKDEQIFAHVVEHCTVEKGEKYWCIYIIFNRRDKFTPMKYSVLAHEAVHATDLIFKRKGAKGFNEPYAYLVEYFVSKICKFLNIKDRIK